MGISKWAWGVGLLFVAFGCGSGNPGSSEGVTQSASESLIDCHALPDWSIKTYGGGDRVAHKGTAYQCKPYPYSGWCGQAGYEPGVATNWADAWTKVDVCSASTGSGGASGTGGSSSGGASGNGGASASNGTQITGYCPGNPAQCCPPGYTPVVLTPGGDRYQTGTPMQCIVGLGGINVIGAQGGNHVVIGGPDTDIIQSANGDNFVVPGPGIDTVATGVGNDTVYIFDLCELQSGDTIDMGTGHNTLVAPLPLDQLRARGLVIANVSEVVVQQNSCRSQCSTHPDCSGHGHCIEGATPGAMACGCDTGFRGDHCEKDAIPDTDGDNLDDLIDACPVDPKKTAPGLCGCGTPETDTDKDGIPDCFDFAPGDPKNSYPGACGASDNPDVQPAGKACTVEACSGSRQQATCDGHGQCGVPNCNPLAQGCVWKTFRDSGYWICSGPASWTQADAACQKEPGRSLVEVDDRIENLWLASIAGDNAWLGGNDLTDNGRWAWSYNKARNRRPFWDKGQPLLPQFNQWHAGSPGTGQCMKLAKDGTWSDSACTETRGFVCEQPLLRLPPSLHTPCSSDFFPNVPSDSCKPVTPVGPCVDGSTVFPNDNLDPVTHLPDPAANLIEAKQMSDACTAACTSDLPGCAAACKGFTTLPPLGKSCQPFTNEERALCSLVSFDINSTCSVKSPTCPGTSTCGRAIECAALNASQQAIKCSATAPCASGQQCNTRLGYCIDVNRTSSCSDKDASGKCVGLCFGAYACGEVAPNCPTKTNDPFLNRCDTTNICPDPGSIVENVDPTKDPASNLGTQEFPATSVFPEPDANGPAPTPYPLAKPPGCGGTGEPACDYAIGAHPWCQFKVTETPAPKDVSDAKPPFGDKHGTSGGAGPISFSFDPNLDISYNFHDPLPIGDTHFGAHAEASANASAHFELFKIKGDVNILDAKGSLDVDRCGFDNNARLALFGVDFLPAVLGESVSNQLAAAKTSQATRTTCENSLIAIQTSVNKAQKALRDAQELIRQEKELVANGGRFSADLCHQLLEKTGGKGVPANFPSAAEPFAGCGDLTPEDTVNLFVRYYKQQVAALAVDQATALGATKNLIPNVDIQFLDQIPTTTSNIDDARRETQQIANINFAIGPIPMNLTVEAFVEYGLAGNLSMSLTPGAIAAAYTSGSNEDLASVNASFAPFAGAGVSMFVGVGFDFGGLSAKIGISGDVTLGVVSVPLSAGAGVGVQALNDERALPTDMTATLESSNMLFPPGLPKKFRFNAHYMFGVSADIQDILVGSIDAKLRIKFLWFSKTWQKRITQFGPAFNDIHIPIISGEGSAAFSTGELGFLGFIHMPLTFVDFAELQPPPPLDPLPPPPPGSAGAQPDPRYKGFDSSRVDELFYAGYCDCKESGACAASLECCGSKFCALDTTNNGKSCVSCLNLANPVTGHGQPCTSPSQCCDSGDKICDPFAVGGPKYCRACVASGQPMTDGNKDSVPDFSDECCSGLKRFNPPVVVTPATSTAGAVYKQNAGPPICQKCSAFGSDCNTQNDCCQPQDQTAPRIPCTENFTCGAIVK